MEEKEGKFKGVNKFKYFFIHLFFQESYLLRGRKGGGGGPSHDSRLLDMTNK